MVTDHPTLRAHAARPPRVVPDVLDADALRALVLEAGADDVGFVELDRASLAEEAGHARRAMPSACVAVSFVVRMTRHNVQSPDRSVANVAFHTAGRETDEVARRVVKALEDQGIGALHPAMGFPMEMDRFPGRTWVISHKPVAVEAGLGAIGVHRNLIHPRFGSFVLLGTILIDRPVSRVDAPIAYTPCLDCRLCVAACPVGAIRTDGFDFTACYTHNYREFMGGFTDWVGEIADSRDRHDYHRRVGTSASASMWQSLSHGANYKAAYCVAVCPAGSEVIAPFADDRKGYTQRVVKPLRDKVEKVYVLPDSDAGDHVRKRYPHKQAVEVHSQLVPDTVTGFLRSASLAFQVRRAADVRVALHMTFTGPEAQEATLRVDGGVLSVDAGHVGEADAHVRVDGQTWLDLVAGRVHPVWAVVTGRLWVRGPLAALRRFQACFPNP